MGWAPVNRPLNPRRQDPLRRREIPGVAGGVIARGSKLQFGRFRSSNGGDRRCLLNRSEQCDSGTRSTPTGQPQLWKMQKCNRRNGREVDSASFGHCTLSISGYGTARMCTEARNPGRLAFSPRPRPLLSAWAQPRTGTPDDAGGRGRSSGPGCADRAAPSPAARRSAPSPGDWSMVSAPTRSPLCGLPRLIGSLLSQESVHNRNSE